VSATVSVLDVVMQSNTVSGTGQLGGIIGATARRLVLSLPNVHVDGLGVDIVSRAGVYLIGAAFVQSSVSVTGSSFVGNVVNTTACPCPMHTCRALNVCVCVCVCVCFSNAVMCRLFPLSLTLPLPVTVSRSQWSVWAASPSSSTPPRLPLTSQSPSRAVASAATSPVPAAATSMLTSVARPLTTCAYRYWTTHTRARALASSAVLCSCTTVQCAPRAASLWLSPTALSQPATVRTRRCRCVAVVSSRCTC
jgi:hypothetical protein